MTTLDPGASDVLTQGLRFRPSLDGVLGQQRGADHDRGVGGVRARGDRGDHHRAVIHRGVGTVLERDLDGVRRPGPVAGATGSEAGNVWARPLSRLSFVDVIRQGVAEGRLGVGERDPVLRALRPGDGRDHGGQVQREFLGVPDLVVRGVGLVPEPLLLGVRLDQGQLLRRAPGEGEVVQGVLVDREDRAGGAELRGHVADGRAVGYRYRGHAVAVELDELADHAVLAQQLGDGEHQVGGGRAARQLAGAAGTRPPWG